MILEHNHLSVVAYRNAHRAKHPFWNMQLTHPDLGSGSILQPEYCQNELIFGLPIEPNTARFVLTEDFCRLAAKAWQLTRKRYKENTGPGGILDHNNLACIVTYSRR